MDENNPYNRLVSEDLMMEIEERKEDPLQFDAPSSQQRVHPDVGDVRRSLMHPPPKRENWILRNVRCLPTTLEIQTMPLPAMRGTTLPRGRSSCLL